MTEVFPGLGVVDIMGRRICGGWDCEGSLACRVVLKVVLLPAEACVDRSVGRKVRPVHGAHVSNPAVVPQLPFIMNLQPFHNGKWSTIFTDGIQ